MRTVAYASYLSDEFFLEASCHVKTLTTMRQAYYEKSKLYKKTLKMRHTRSVDGQGKLGEGEIWKGDLPILTSLMRPHSTEYRNHIVR